MSLGPGTRAAPWHDLVRLTPRERLVELALPLPWLLVSLALYATPAWPLGLVAAFYFFLTGLRLSHNAQHCCLGVSRGAHDAILAALSVGMGASMHAVQTTHLHHHRHELGPEDVEGRVARLAFPRILLAGPGFILALHRVALARGTRRQRRWVAAELCAIAPAWAALGVVAGPRVAALHAAAMLTGECLTAFFAVWIVHRGADGTPTRARTERKRWVHLLTFDMLLHADHHAYPAVPTIHWRALAARRTAAGERVEPDVVA